MDGSLGAGINFAYAYMFSALLLIFPVFCVCFYKNNFEIFRDVEKINEVDEKEEYQLKRSS